MAYPLPDVRAASTTFFALSLALTLTAATLTACTLAGVLPAAGFVAAGVAAASAAVATVTQWALPWLICSPPRRTRKFR